MNKAGCFAVGVACLAWGSVSDGAELRMRKELIEQQADRALIVARGRFDHVKDTVNPLAKDCDLHAPLRLKTIRVAVVGEFMNACSTGINPAEIRKLTATAPAEIRGVFRIWFEHPGNKGEDLLTEEEALAVYTTSNPAHAVEIHPITRVGKKGFLNTIGPIAKDGEFFPAKATTTLKSYLKRKITVDEFDGRDGEEYISIQSGGSLPNYFKLDAQLASALNKTDDGLSATIDVLDGDEVAAKGIRVFSIADTAAHAKFSELKKGERFAFGGISRMNLRRVLNALDQAPGEPIGLPMEFVILAVEN